MKNNYSWKVCLAAIAVLAIKMSALGDTVVYSDSTVDSGQSLTLTSGVTIGNQITLAGSGPYMLTDFSFEYYTPQISFSSTITADVRLYLNNGPTSNGYATPGSVFYDSGSFNFETAYQANGNQPTNVATVDFAPILYSGAAIPLSSNNPIALNFTFTITLNNVGTNVVGAELFSPTTVGANDGAYWYNNGTGWELLTNSTGGPSTIGARFSAVSTPDESSTLLLGVLAMTSLFGASKLRFSKPVPEQVKK